jgi:acetyl-CoA acetyltransferase
VAERYGVTRERQDAFALRSQQRAAAAQEQGRFAAELVSVSVPGRKGEVTCVERDEHPRPDTTPEQLSNCPRHSAKAERLRRAIRPG